MEIVFEILYRQEVVKHDIPSLSPDVKATIKSRIEEKLMTSPHVFGKPLRNSLFSLRSLRVGDYRVIFTITPPKTVTVAVIQHRSKAYEIAAKRAR